LSRIFLCRNMQSSQDSTVPVCSAIQSALGSPQVVAFAEEETPLRDLCLRLPGE